MSNSVFAKDVTLHDLEEKFSLQLIDDPQFFLEWQTDMPPITPQEEQLLDKLKAGYLNLIRFPPLLEHIVQLSVLSPLLYLADYFLSPFRVTTETEVEIANEDDDMLIEGKIDVLVLKEHLWVMVIESKRASFSVEVGLAQLLSYMLANPSPLEPNLGLITTGGSFLFVKLLNGSSPRYGLSRVFELRNPGNELYSVLRILKHFRQLFL